MAMAHFASRKFWRCYEALPPPIRRLADKNHRLMELEPRHPSLRFKRIGRFWSVRIGDDYRTLGVDVEDGILWIWIGPHSEYEKIV
jgi:hypothetical protein